MQSQPEEDNGREDGEHNARGRQDVAGEGSAQYEGEAAAEQQRIDAEGCPTVEDLLLEQEVGQGLTGGVARKWAEDDSCEAELEEPSAVTNEEDEPGPDEVELLFNAERPEVAKVELDVREGEAVEMAIGQALQRRVRSHGAKAAQEVADI